MDLINALGLKRYTTGDSPIIAFVGAGGKTTALLEVAESIGEPVVITTTTHLGTWQVPEHYTHIIVADDEHLHDVIPHTLSDKPLLITRGRSEENRYRGVQPETVETLKGMYQGRGVFILVEADGARGLSIKAPAEHEPVMPPHVDEVLVVVGLDILGKPISPETVHRLNYFCEITGAKPGDCITAEMILKLLLGRNGGLKNIPEDATRAVLFTHVDTSEKLSIATRLAQSLLAEYHRVVMADLEKGVMENKHHLVVKGFRGRVGGVVLAGGGSERFGAPKQLLDWRGKPLLRHVVETGLDAGLEPITVVLGAERDKLASTVCDLDLRLVWNQQWAQGQGASVRVGTKSIYREVTAIIFLLSDQPFVDRNVIISLKEAYWRKKAAITAPVAGGKRANPVLFDEVTFDDLIALSGEVGGKQLFAKFPVHRIPWLDERILLDIDTPEDYQRAIKEMI